MDLLATGVLKGPHGIHGFIKLHSYSDEFAHFADLDVLSLRKNGKERQLKIEEVRPAGKDILIKFIGVDTPEKAREYNGWEIWVPRTSAAKLDDGEFYVADLVQCSLLVEGVVVGRIVGVVDGPQALLMEVEHVADGKLYLVPFMERYIGTVDLERKEMELLAPELLS